MDPEAAQRILGQPEAPPSLAAVAEALESVDPWTADNVEEALRLVPERLQFKPKTVFQAVRVAVTGSTVSLPLFESIALLGREETLARLRTA